MRRSHKQFRVRKQAAAFYLLLVFLAGWLQGSAVMKHMGQAAAQRTEVVSINSQAALLVDAAGETRYALQEEEPLYPASLTKLLTAWVVVKHCPDLEQKVTVQTKTLAHLVGTGASTAGLSAGECLTLRELLTALLRPSGADAALVLAEKVGGSETGFVRLMNEEAQALGMTRSHFANASGLDDSQQYSTASDLMRLWRAVLGQEALKSIVTLDEQTGRWQSTLLTYDTPVDWSGGRILGGKTGYTKQAGQCLASYAQVGDRIYYLVTLGAPGEAGGSGQHLLDAQTLYSWAAAQRR